MFTVHTVKYFNLAETNVFPNDSHSSNRDNVQTWDGYPMSIFSYVIVEKNVHYYIWFSVYSYPEIV